MRDCQADLGCEALHHGGISQDVEFRAGRFGADCRMMSGTADVGDAIVIVTAVRHQAPVVTSDPGDLTRIADSIGVKIRLFPT